MNTFLPRLLGLIVLIRFCTYAAVLEEANEGELAVLHCPSNDEKHRFQYWYSDKFQQKSKIIGPGHERSPRKYKYTVLTGMLFIHDVELNETGDYTCVSKVIGNQTQLYSATVRLKVTPIVYRAVLLVGVASILGVLIFILYNFRRSPSSIFNKLWFETEVGELEDDETGPIPLDTEEEIDQTAQPTNTPYSSSALDTSLPSIY